MGYDVVVADTVNHLLRGVDLDTGEVSTVAGTGRPWRGSVDFDPHPAGEVDLSSPWDVVWYQGRVIVAMAGIHQLWWFDPTAGTAGVYAGTTVEALRDGALDQVWMAQPSGLSVSPDGTTLWIADSESSALRFVRDGVMHTAVGQGLFDFGHMDGPASQALFQHPLGVCCARGRRGAGGGHLQRCGTPVRPCHSRLCPQWPLVWLSRATSWFCPDGRLLVVESAAHRIVPLDPTGSAVSEKSYRTERPPTLLAPGEVALSVIFTPAPGQKLDESFGPSTRLQVSASPPELLVSGAGTTTDLDRTLVISSDVDGGVLQVVAQAATCDVDAEHAACHLTRQDWGVPIVVDPDRRRQAAADSARLGRAGAAVRSAARTAPAARRPPGAPPVPAGSARPRPVCRRAGTASPPWRR